MKRVNKILCFSSLLIVCFIGCSQFSTSKKLDSVKTSGLFCSPTAGENSKCCIRRSLAKLYSPIFPDSICMSDVKNVLSSIGRRVKNFRRNRDCSHINIIAEGDSWFNFPTSFMYTKGCNGKDLLGHLEDFNKNYNFLRLACAGDTLENMVLGTQYGKDYTPIKSQFIKTIEHVKKIKPQVFLFSGGGNDVVGESFLPFLNRNDDCNSHDLLNRNYLNNFMEHFVYNNYRKLIMEVLEVSPETKIILHGYAYLKPDGRYITLSKLSLAGPWLLPYLIQKRITSPKQQQLLIKDIIDNFNNVLIKLSNEFLGKVYHVDLRPIITDDEEIWHDEIHLSDEGWKIAAQAFHETIQLALQKKDKCNN